MTDSYYCTGTFKTIVKKIAHKNHTGFCLDTYNYCVCSLCPCETECIKLFTKENFTMPIIKRPVSGLSATDICPVCGYYCLGKGGIGCIDKPGI